MNKFINLIHFIRGRILVIILLIIQLIITLLTYSNYLYVKNYSSEYLKSINQKIPLSNTFVLKRSSSDFGAASLSKYNVRKEFIDYMSSINNVTLFISNCYQPSSSKVKEGYSTKVLQDVKAEMASNILFLYELNQNNYDYVKSSFSLDSGDYLPSTSTNETIPVLAGIRFKKLYNIGDIIETPNEKLQIKGFLKKGEFIIDKNLSKIDLDDSLVSNHLNLNDEVTMANSFGHINIIINDNKIDETVKLINEKATALNIDVYLVKSSTIMDDLVASFENNIQSLKVKTYFYLVLSICGLTGILFYSILDRKKDFGILLSQGASAKNIISLIISEQFFILIISFIITLILGNLRVLNIISNYSDISIIYYIKSLFLEIIIIVISSIPPIIKIITLSPKDLIGGLRE